MALELLETNIVLDVYDHDGERPSIKSIALDDNTRYVFARLTYQGNTYDIGSTATVRLVIIRPDKVGTKIIGEPKEIQMGQADESIVTVYGAYAELVQPAIAVAGTLFGQFIITYGDQILRSQIFAINNGEALDADEWAGEYDGYSGIDELVAKVDAVVAKVDGMETDVSDLKIGLNSKVAIEQGTDHAGEALIIGDDGNVTTGRVGLIGCQSINSIDEMNTVTAEKVLVLHNNSAWGNGGPCWFEYLGYATEGGYARQDGGKMYPMLDQGPLIASTPPVETMMSLISSYVENDSLVYGNNHTLFESETTNEIDCSAFVSAILHGIAYSYSKYTGASVNRRAEKISSYSPTPLETSLNPPLQRLRTRYMAQYFAEQGWLHKMPSYLNMRDVLQFGDILFSWDGTGTAENRFLKIGHVSIVLAVLDSTQIIVAQCGGYPSDPSKPPVVTVQNNSSTVGKISTINLNEENISTYFSAFARIPYTAQIDAGCVGNKIKPVFIPNTYIDESRKGVESISGICATSYGYIKVNPGSTLTFTGSSEHRGYELIAMVAEYNKDLQFIAKTRFTSTPKTLTASTRYIKLCFAHPSSGDRPPMLLEDIEQFEATIS